MLGICFWREAIGAAVGPEAGISELLGNRRRERCSGAAVGGVSAQNIIDLQRDLAMFGNFGSVFTLTTLTFRAALPRCFLATVHF